MTEDTIQKSADQILEEIFSTLVSDPVTKVETTSGSSNLPSYESPTSRADTISTTNLKPETNEKSIIPEKKKKKKKEKKKTKKKKRKRDDENDEDSKKRGKEKKKKKDVPASNKEPSKGPKTKPDPEARISGPVISKEAKKNDVKLGTSPKAKEVTKRHDEIVSKTPASEPSKKEKKLESKPNVKDVAKKEDKVESRIKKDEKTEPKPRTKEEFKKVTRTDTKVDGNAKLQSETRPNEGGRRKRSESRRSPSSPKRRKSRSRSPIVRRPPLRRSRSRSPPRRVRVRQRSRSPARSLSHHRKRSRSPAVLKRPPTPPKSPRIDKAQLLEFARQNLKRMQEMGSLPAGVAVPNQPAEVIPASTQFTGKTVAELTDYCKHLMADRSGENDEKLGKKESESTFTRHPFQIKPRSDTIVMNIRNAVALPVRKPEERVVAQAQLKQQFPVSSGQQHLDLEWVPVTPVVKEPNNASGPKQVPKAITASVAPTPRVPLPVAEPPSADIGSIVAQRISSIRKLQENQFDVQARLELEEAESMTQNWATFHHTNPMTGEPIPELINWSGAPQAWVKKDLFTSAAPVASGVGMKLLQKMGWQPGEGLGRHGEGNLEPLSLDIKMDKKGLFSKEEMMGPIRSTFAVKLIQEFQGKHPVSILHELCTKHHWEPPVFEQVLDIGPDHLKHFLFKVAVNGIEYQACLASTTKKEAKAQSAAACLQALGIFAPPGP